MPAAIITNMVGVRTYLNYGLITKERLVYTAGTAGEKLRQHGADVVKIGHLRGRDRDLDRNG
jgi:hypothetical protein